MIRKKIKFIIPMILCFTLLAGCASRNQISTGTQTAGSSDTGSVMDVTSNLEQIDNTKWQFNKEDNVFYQIGLSYCETPVDENYETLSIFVPGAYMTSDDNGDGTYTCKINVEAKVGDYTANTAPYVFPVNTPGYAAQSPLTEYQSFTQYTEQGFIYVHAGCRGREAGAPAAVTDLKAAIRYIRYNEGMVAGDTERIFSFGMSGGGAQSALLGTTGDSKLYDDYLDAIGAVEGVSDAILGSMDWCPITSLESADAAYEWNMGNTRSNLSEEEQNISDELTAAYAEYINSIGLTSEDGSALTLEESEDGRYQAGTYYEYIKEQIEASLNHFLEDTTFPYNADSSSQGHQAGMGGNGGMTRGNKPDLGNNDGKIPQDGTRKFPGETDNSTNNEDGDFTANDDIARTDDGSGITISGSFETIQDYIDALNVNGQWVTYDEKTNTATISSIADFTSAVKNSAKSFAAFDQLDATQGENILFGYEGTGAHFDSVLAEILEKADSEYATDYASDIQKTDELGNTIEDRLNMYSPLYYLLESSEGYETSTVAKYFRIRTGAWQSDTSITTEINLALALELYDGVEGVDFETVWGQEHIMAERTGDSTTNFIEWVNKCCAKEEK